MSIAAQAARRRVAWTLGAIAVAWTFCEPLQAQSRCFGTPAHGRLENGVQLPRSGANFSAYSALAGPLGRTHVHEQVRDVVVAAYGAMEKVAPGKVFVYGETGAQRGGPFKPHRSHENGLSVDFMVPVLDAAGKSVPLPTHAANRFGYGIEFDTQARFEGLRIDFEAMAEHLVQLHQAARGAGIDVGRVIFTPAFLPRLFATTRGPYLQAHLRFMQREAWVRHDEHYHLDFDVACQPMAH